MDVKDAGLRIAATLVVAIQELGELNESDEKKHADLKKIFNSAVRKGLEDAEDLVTEPLPDVIEAIAKMVLDSDPVEGLEDKAADVVSGVAAEVAYQLFKLFRGIVGSDIMRAVLARAEEIKTELEV